MRIEHRRGDDAGRRRRHEGLDRLRGEAAERRAEHAALLLGRAEIVVDHVGDRLRRVRHLAAAGRARGRPFGEGREVDVVARPRAFRTRRRSPSCAAPRRSGSRPAAARRRSPRRRRSPSAVRRHGAPRFRRAAPARRDRSPRPAPRGSAGPTGRLARQAADVGRENPLFAAAHRYPPSFSSRHREWRPPSAIAHPLPSSPRSASPCPRPRFPPLRCGRHGG